MTHGIMGADHVGSAETEGMVIHWAGFYDGIMTVMFLGREARFRRRMLDAADLQPGQHDVVISTLVFHHLTRQLQSLAMAEMRRVLLPGGRLVVIDFGGARQIGRLTAHATAVGFSEVGSRRLGPSFLFALTARTSSATHRSD